ncbi:MAG: relaxase domain-containing protein [bacterium]|nr:relaxase domain-containing protein [bacterium]
MVATVHELASSALAVSYYEKDGYYTRNDPEHRKASFWHGRAAADLGLRGHVAPSRFESVLSGKVPKTDIRLGRLVEGERQHRPGWDITLSAPKSVSLEALVMGDTRVMRAHDEAVRATLDWIERDLLQTRGWDPATKRRPRVKADGMVVAGFRHLTSRDLDPQLHTHCIVANMTRAKDGAWKSIEPTSLRRNEKLIGAHYRNELASRLTTLGFAVTPRMIGPVPGFELAGYDGEFLDAFSGRRREILAYLDRHGLPHTREATQKATLHTRRRKVEAGLTELVPQWRARARALGLSRDATALHPPRPTDPETGREMPLPRRPDAGLTKNERRRRRRSPSVPHIEPAAEMPPRRRRTRTRAPAERIAEPETGVLEAVARAVAHVEERRTIIPESDIRALVLGHAPGRYRLEDIDESIERLVREGELRETALRGSDRSFVTDRAVKAERKILKAVKQGKDTVEALVPDETVAARLAETGLTAGQAEAVRHILGNGDRIVGVQGRAGTGKTTMLKEVTGLVEQPLTGLAPSAAAARVLAKEAGIPTRTLQWFLVRYGDLSDPDRLEEARAALSGSVLAVDEASMIGTVAMERLVAIAEKTGIARVVLVGDTAQLKAVNAGQPFALMQRAGMATATMDEVLRQKDPDLKQAVAHAREGEAGAAMTRLANRVIEHAREDLGVEAARAWLALPPEERDSCAVLAPTHAVRREINAAIREGLEEEGRLLGRTLTIQRLVNRRYTRIEASVLANYEPGDTVVFHRDAYGCRVDDLCTVTGIEDSEVVLDHADGEERRFRPSGNAAHNLGAYESVPIEIRAGDRVRWTRNRKARRLTPALVNGEEARVLSIGPERVRLMAADGTEYSLHRKDPHLRHIDHAWSSTVHGAQGRTAAKVIAVLDAGLMANQEMFYVEVSRASEGFTLLTDDREALIECLETSPDVPDAALEALGEDLDGAIVDPDEWADVVAAWRTVEEEARGSGKRPFDVQSYAGVMARIAAFAAVEDLPDDQRAFVDRSLAAHDGARAAERQVKDLLAGLQTQSRRWPELAWAAAARGSPTQHHPAWRAWRDEGTVLVDAARQRLDLADDGLSDLSADNRRRLEMTLARVEAVRLKDDAARFARDWRTLLERGKAQTVPVSLLEGYADLAGRGAALAQATALTADERRAVEAWQARHGQELEIVDDIRSSRERAGTLVNWLDGHVAVDGEAGVDPGVVSWKRDAVDRLRHVRSLLDPHGACAAYLAGMPGLRDDTEAGAREIENALRSLDRATLLWRVNGIAGRARATAELPLDMPEWPGMLGEMMSAVDSADPGAPAVGHLALWVAEDGRWRRNRSHVAALLGRLTDLEKARPRYAGDDGAADAADRQAWLTQAEALGGELAFVEALPESERTAHLAARGMTVAAFRSLARSLPLWLATGDALGSLADWSERAAAVLRDGKQGPAIAPGDADAVSALIEEGRALPRAWADASLPAVDMEGAAAAVETVIGRLEAAWLAHACQAFDGLCRSVNREMKDRDIHPLDTAAWPRLVKAITDLAGREDVPDETRDLMDDWREADREWKEERRETEALVGKTRTLAETGEALAARHAGADDPDAVAWRAQASAALTAARAMLADDTLKGRHLDAVANARHDLETAVAAIESAAVAHARFALLQRVREIESQAKAAGTLPLDDPEWAGALETIRGIAKDGEPEDRTLRYLARRLDDDERWRLDRDRLRAAVERMTDLRERRPRYGGNMEEAMAEPADRHAWVREAADVAAALEAATATLTDRERAAHLAACGTTSGAVDHFVDMVPAWQEADAALGRLAGWRARASRAVRDGDAAAAGDLIEEGRNLPVAAAAPFLGDTSGAKGMIRQAAEKLDAVLLEDACAAFARLTGAVEAEAKAKDIHPIGTADWPRLVEAMTTLAGMRRVPQGTRDLVGQWREAERWWREERHEAANLIRQSMLLETERTAHLKQAGGRPGPLPQSWRRDAETFMEDAGAFPDRGRLIQAMGGDADYFESILDAIPRWLEADDRVREEAARDDHLRRLQDATDEILKRPLTRTIPWDGTEPLLEGDRLAWVDHEGRHDAIVDGIESMDDDGRIESLVLCPVEDAPGPLRIHHADQRRRPRPGPVGLALLGVELRVVGDDDTPIASGEVGEIEFKGPNVFSDYWRMPEKTAEEFSADG